MDVLHYLLYANAKTPGQKAAQLVGDADLIFLCFTWWRLMGAVLEHRIAYNSDSHGLACVRMYLWRDWTLTLNAIGWAMSLFLPSKTHHILVTVIAVLYTWIIYQMAKCDKHQGLWTRAKNMAKSLTMSTSKIALVNR